MGETPTPAELIEVQGAECCIVHLDGVLLETGSGSCDLSDDDQECIGAPLYRNRGPADG